MTIIGQLLSREHELRPALDALALTIATAGKDVAYNTCPVRTGNLRSTIHIEKMDDGYAVISGGVDAPYAPFVCFGTENEKYPKNNYMGRGYEAAKARAAQLMQGRSGQW